MIKKKWSGYHKSVARGNCVNADRVYRRVIDLPGENIFSLCNPEKNGYVDQGCIDSKTEYIAVERDALTANKIASKLKKQGINFKLIEDNLEDISFDGTFDLLNLDLMCAPNLKFLNWLSNIELCEQAEVNCWFPSGWRGQGRFEHDLIHSLLHTNTTGGYGVYLKIMSHVGPEWPKELNQRLTICAIVSALNRYDLEVESPFSYCDHRNKMCVYRFLVKRMLDEPRWPHLFDILETGTPFDQKRYEANPTSELNGDMSICDMCVKLSKRTDFVRDSHSYLTFRIKSVLQVRVERDKSNPIQVKAGWKSCIAKMPESSAIKVRACSFIDRVLYI